MRDCPHHIFDAVRRALVYLSFEELPKDERPPKRIWQDADGLKAWFDRVERDREDRSRGREIDDPVENEAAKGLIVDG